jgi:hypothetical protein
MNYSVQYLIRGLEKNGYAFRRSNGSIIFITIPVTIRPLLSMFMGKRIFPKARFTQYLSNRSLTLLIYFDRGFNTDRALVLYSEKQAPN